MRKSTELIEIKKGKIIGVDNVLKVVEIYNVLE